MFKCEICYYTTDRSSNLKRHFETKKHIVNAHQESKKQGTCEFICTSLPKMGTLVPKTYEQIANFPKNEEKKGENFMEKKGEFAIQGHIYGTMVPQAPKIENEKNNENSLTHVKSNLILNNNVKYKCENCEKSYSSKKHLQRHKDCTICGSLIKKKENEKNSDVIKLKKQMEEMSKEIMLLKNNQYNKSTKLVKTDETNAIYSNNLNSNNINSNNDNSTNKTIVLNYVNNTYYNAQPLKMLRENETTEMLKIDHEKYDIIDFIIFYYKKYELHTFLGDIIIKAFKKDDPREQRFWVSSVINLTFIVRQILNKRLEWKKDMNGTVIVKNIINPILKKVLSMLQEYIVMVKEKSKKSKTIYEIEELNNNSMITLKIIIDINNKSLHKQILKHIAPQFQLNCEETNFIENEKKPKKKIL